MDAIGIVLLLAISSPSAVIHTENFSVFATSSGDCKRLADDCEKARREIAIRWLGRELPVWGCRAVVQVVETVSAATGLASPAKPNRGFCEHRIWLFGSVEDVRREVLRHEISHLVLASVADKIPVWIDEGIAAQCNGDELSKLVRERLASLLRQSNQSASLLCVFQQANIGPHDLDAYAMSASLVQFALIHRNGNAQEAFTLLMHAKNADGLALALGYPSPRHLESAWRQWAKKGNANVVSIRRELPRAE